MWPHKKACEESVGLERGEEEKLIKMERNEKKTHFGIQRVQRHRKNRGLVLLAASLLVKDNVDGKKVLVILWTSVQRFVFSLSYSSHMP